MATLVRAYTKIAALLGVALTSLRIVPAAAHDHETSMGSIEQHHSLEIGDVEVAAAVQGKPVAPIAPPEALPAGRQLFDSAPEITAEPNRSFVWASPPVLLAALPHAVLAAQWPGTAPAALVGAGRWCRRPRSQGQPAGANLGSGQGGSDQYAFA